MVKIVKSAIQQLLVILLLLAAIPLLAANYLSNEIFSPPRRALQVYHLDYLKHPNQHGMKIQKYDCLAGQAPCLLVEANGKAGAAKRGNILRRQVSNKGIALDQYGKSRGVMVLLHGRNGRKEDLLPIAERFVAVGFRCIIPDLPAHGESPLTAMSFGSSQFEKTLARRVLKDVQAHFKLPDEPAILWGMSMGGAFAVSAAHESPDTWSGLIVVNSFSRLDVILDRQLKGKWRHVAGGVRTLINMVQFLKARPSITTMQPKDWAKTVKTPVMVIHAKRDPFVSITQGRKLYESFKSDQKRWVEVSGAGHTNVLRTAMPLYAEMSTWIIRSIIRI